MSQEVEEIDFDGKLKFPFSLLCIGGSSTGKSSIFDQIILRYSDIVDLSEVNGEMPEIIYIYSIAQPQFEKHKDKVKYYRGWDHNDLKLENLKQKRNVQIFLDDVLDQTCPELLKLLHTQFCHHFKIAICSIAHNIFQKNYPHWRTIVLNTHYVILTRSLQSINSIKNFFIQLFPTQSRDLMEIYNEVTEVPFSHLLIDSHPLTVSRFRIRSNIFHTPEKPTIVYMLEQNKKKR